MKNETDWKDFMNSLDQVCPDWSHQIVSIKQIGDLVAVTASVVVAGVTRQGIGTGSAYDESGIKNAEYNALQRAAVKFSVARELLESSGEVIEMPEPQKAFSGNPMARTMAELVTPRQLVAIRAISNGQRLDPEDECHALFGERAPGQRIKPEELSRKAASAFIDYLKIGGSAAQSTTGEAATA
jgi:hypothetical protein